MKLSPDGAVWTCEPVDVAALLPVPSRWQRDEDQNVACWQFDGGRWLIDVADVEPVDPLDVPDLVQQLLPGRAT